MNQITFINTLKQALHSLPSAKINSIADEYEFKFIQGLAAGKSEEMISKELGDPKKLANKILAQYHLSNFFATKTLANFWRVLISLIGLIIFNFFMAIPAIVFMSLLMSSFAVAVAIFIAGSALTATGLSGSTAFNIGDFDHKPAHHRHYDINKSATSADTTMTKVDEDVYIMGKDVPLGNDDLVNLDVLQNSSNTERVWAGIALSIGGVLLFLLNLLIAKYTLLGLKHYARLNWQVLRGPVVQLA